jgi:1-aminocyclopropane-1-carboxylate synthase
MGGYRTGVLYTQNASILKALANINYFTTVSNDTQDCLAVLLQDEIWVDGYLAESRRLLRASYDVLTSILELSGIPYARATSGMFVWLEFTLNLTYLLF